MNECSSSQKYTSLVSREHYLSFFTGEHPDLIQAGQEEFDDVAGKGENHLPSAIVDEHLRDLHSALNAIEHYVDRRIAHYDKRGLACPAPTFGDLSSALQTIEKLVILYWQLLKGASMTTFLPTIQFDCRTFSASPGICRSYMMSRKSHDVPTASG